MKLASQVNMDYGFEEFIQTVANLDSQKLDWLADAIHVRRMEIMAGALKARGFGVKLSTDIGEQTTYFRYLMIYDPAGQYPGEWATLDESRRLLDTVADLSPADAFARWRDKIEPVIDRPYTRADAIRDMQAAQENARADYEAGRDNAEDYRIAHNQTREFLDYVEEIPTDLITQGQAVFQEKAPSIQAVNNAIRDRRLRGYPNPNTHTQRQGAILVSKAAVNKLWPHGGE